MQQLVVRARSTLHKKMKKDKDALIPVFAAVKVPGSLQRVARAVAVVIGALVCLRIFCWCLFGRDSSKLR
jgi:hypothetical protein